MTDNPSVHRGWAGVRRLATWPQAKTGVPNEIRSSVLRVTSSLDDWCVQLSVLLCLSGSTVHFLRSGIMSSF